MMGDGRNSTEKKMGKGVESSQSLLVRDDSFIPVAVSGQRASNETDLISNFQLTSSRITEYKQDEISNYAWHHPRAWKEGRPGWWMPGM